jgi:hypothetical protein
MFFKNGDINAIFGEFISKKEPAGPPPMTTTAGSSAFFVCTVCAANLV